MVSGILALSTDIGSGVQISDDVCFAVPTPTFRTYSQSFKSQTDCRYVSLLVKPTNPVIACYAFLTLTGLTILLSV